MLKLVVAVNGPHTALTPTDPPGTTDVSTASRCTPRGLSAKATPWTNVTSPAAEAKIVGSGGASSADGGGMVGHPGPRPISCDCVTSQRTHPSALLSQPQSPSQSAPHVYTLQSTVGASVGADAGAAEGTDVMLSQATRPTSQASVNWFTAKHRRELRCMQGPFVPC